MEKLFTSIIISTIYASVTGLLILLIKLLLKDKLTANWSYILWLILIIKLIIPFGPESNISIFNKFELNKYYQTNIEYKINENKLLNNKYTDLEMNFKREYIDGLNKNLSLCKSKKNYSKIFKYNSFVWIVIFINLMLIAYLSYLKLLYKFSENRITSERINIIFINSKKKCNILNNIDLIINDEINTPAILGFIKPKILFPRTLVDLSDKEIEFIFIHELCHYKRKDNYLCNILILLQYMHWFNPFIGYLFKKIRQDIELATDYKVAKIIGYEELRLYGHTLLIVLSNINNKKYTLTLIRLVNNKRDIEERIMNIKNINKQRKNKVALTLIGILTIGIISPLVLTDKSNQVIYANTNYNNYKDKEKLSVVQGKYFEVSSLLRNNSNLMIDKADELLKSTNYIERLGNDKGFKIIYKYENEEIEVYKDTKNPYKVGSITYNIYNPNKDLTLFSINSENYTGDGWKCSIRASSTSIDKINGLGIKLNTQIINSNLYENYKSIIKETEIGNKLDDRKLYDINCGFKNKILENPGVSYYQTSLNNNVLTVCNINETKNLESISLTTLDKSGELVELLDTSNISQSDLNMMEHSLSICYSSLEEINLHEVLYN